MCGSEACAWVDLGPNLIELYSWADRVCATSCSGGQSWKPSQVKVLSLYLGAALQLHRLWKIGKDWTLIE